MTRWYLGRTHTNGLKPFKADATPTKETHGEFRQVVGPYRTRRAAVMAAAFGYRNPQFGYVAQRAAPDDYLARVLAYEAQGMTTSDAQAVVDAEDMKCA